MVFGLDAAGVYAPYSGASVSFVSYARPITRQALHVACRGNELYLTLCYARRESWLCGCRGAAHCARVWGCGKWELGSRSRNNNEVWGTAPDDGVVVRRRARWSQRSAGVAVDGGFERWAWTLAVAVAVAVGPLVCSRASGLQSAMPMPTRRLFLVGVVPSFWNKKYIIIIQHIYCSHLRGLLYLILSYLHTIGKILHLQTIRQV